VICSDTSFLFALYGSDVHTSKAIGEVRRMQKPITISLLNEYELLNAIQFAVFRRFLTEFLTFDSNQRVLAEAEGLNVRPIV
jgi:hypothetical protein